GRLDRVRTAGHSADASSADRRAELSGVARRKPLQLPRRHPRPPPGDQNLLVLRDRVHLHPLGELDRARARLRIDRVGPRHAGRLRARTAAAARGQRRREYDAGDGARVLRLLDRLGPSRAGAGWIREGAVRAKGRELRCIAGAAGGGVPRRRPARGGLDSLSSGVAQLPTVRQRVRGREHARDSRGDSSDRVGRADPLLLSGTAGGPRTGARLHPADGGLHAAHLPAPRRTPGGGSARLALIVRLATRQGRTRTMTGSIHIGLAALGAALAVGIIGMKASEAVGRNPGSSTKVMVQSILAIAFAEAIVFYTLFLVQ